VIQNSQQINDFLIINCHAVLIQQVKSSRKSISISAAQLETFQEIGSQISDTR